VTGGVLAGMLLFSSGCRPFAKSPPSEEQLATGSEVFETVCAQCHGDGHGDPTNPALFGSPVLEGPPSEAIRVVLYGQRGKSLVNGELLKGIMPPQAGLSDEEIAGVVAYVRKTFVGRAEAVSPAWVAKARSDGQ